MALMWRLHRFARAIGASDPQRDLDADVHAFTQSLAQQVTELHWVVATARAADGGVDVWLKAAAPVDAAAWQQQLDRLALTSRVVKGRN